MRSHCCSHQPHAQPAHGGDPRYRRVLWFALAINAAMFAVEIGAGLAAASVSLHADALDFVADAATYGISLLVMSRSLRSRAQAALAKGIAMGLFGLWVIGAAIWHAVHATVPQAGTMGVVGVLALAANVATFMILWAYRGGDSNMRSVWLCSRNDAIGNLAVLVAALGVFGTGTGWPDVLVAAIMAVLALQGAATVTRQALSELRAGPARGLHNPGGVVDNGGMQDSSGVVSPDLPQAR